MSDVAPSQKSDLDLLAELFREFERANELLVEALNHLEHTKHPFADVSDFWITRHVSAARILLRVSKRLEELGYPLEQDYSAPG